MSLSFSVAVMVQKYFVHLQLLRTLFPSLEVDLSTAINAGLAGSIKKVLYLKMEVNNMSELQMVQNALAYPWSIRRLTRVHGPTCCTGTLANAIYN